MNYIMLQLTKTVFTGQQCDILSFLIVYHGKNYDNQHKHMYDLAIQISLVKPPGITPFNEKVHQRGWLRVEIKIDFAVDRRQQIQLVGQHQVVDNCESGIQCDGNEFFRFT